MPYVGIDFAGCNLSFVTFPPTDNLYAADLVGTNMTSDTLTGVNLTGANMTAVELQSANLSSANLHGANLDFADFPSTNLTGADLSGATLIGAKWNATTCPDGTASNSYSPQTCIGHGITPPPTGPQGPAGPTGPQGPAGPTGPQGPAGPGALIYQNTQYFTGPWTNSLVAGFTVPAGLMCIQATASAYTTSAPSAIEVGFGDTNDASAPYVYLGINANVASSHMALVPLSGSVPCTSVTGFSLKTFAYEAVPLPNTKTDANDYGSISVEVYSQ
jgi:hypothetical protein